MAPYGQVEYDFRMMMMDKPRISARERHGVFELYAAYYAGQVDVLMASKDWPEVYAHGREVASKFQ